MYKYKVILDYFYLYFAYLIFHFNTIKFSKKLCKLKKLYYICNER